MDAFIDSIRIALRDGASDEERAAGIAACRAILASLEPAAPSPMAALGAVAQALQGVPPEQLLDLAIAKLRSALPPDAHPAPVRPIRFQLIPLPGKKGPT